MNKVFVILGSNIDKENNLPAAVRLLQKRCRVVAISSVYETLPMGTLEQANFFNAAVLLETPLDAATLKAQVLGSIEKKLKRQRSADKNAPRTIDVDIVLFNDEVFEYGHRRVPDPDLAKFAHVAVPVAELAPDGSHPETGEPLATIATRLLKTAVRDGKPLIWKRPDIVLLAPGVENTK